MAEEFAVINPATEEIISRVPAQTEKDALLAVEKSWDAFLDWSTRSYAERAKFLHRVAEVFKDRTEHFAQLSTAEMGKPISQARMEISRCVDHFNYYADNTERLLQPELIEGTNGKGHVVYEPIGPILAIMPWNFPYSQVTRHLAPALAVGNTCLIKHAENVSQCAIAIAEALDESGLPEGVAQVLLIPVPAIAAVIADSRVRAVTLTGSSTAGAKVAAAAGASLKKAVLELGGSDPFIVLRDANIELAVEGAMRTRFSNTGQACAAGKRFIVEREVADEFETRFAAAIAAKKVGDPLDPTTEIGPIARADLLANLVRQVDESIAKGAHVVVGGRRHEGKGYFYEPTLLADCNFDMPVFNEEIFGPVASMTIVDDEEEAIRVANATEYGLGATLWTTDRKKAERLAPRLEAGNVFINNTVMSAPTMPFGGTKRSGYGREGGSDGIHEFVNIKTQMIDGFDS